MFIVKAEPAPKPNFLVADEPSTHELSLGPVDPASLRSLYFAVRERIVQEMDAGCLEAALKLCGEALVLAERLGDEDLIDQAYCNQCEFAMALDSPPESFGRLREIVMRNRAPSIGFAASYNLSYGHTKKKENKKALFYARIARDRALASGTTEYIAKSHNEIGNCLLLESYFEEAIEEYEKALDLLSEEMSPFHVSLHGNLAYAKILLGDRKEGFRLLFLALRWCRRNPDGSVYETWIHLCLAFAYMELGRWRYAWQHGQRGLELAEFTGSHDAIKNALYLVGEIEKCAGDYDAAHQYYSRMQKEYFPDKSNLADMMLRLDTQQLVNLRA